MAFYNSTMGGLRYHTNILNGEISAPVLDKLTQTHMPVHFKQTGSRQHYLTNGYYDIIVLCYDNIDDGRGVVSGVFIGTEEQARFDERLALFGYEQWSYTSYDEDEE